ncbi:MAG TPA: peptidoglycan-binding protein, partial [Vampirovibrionales bacterium]
DVTDIKVGQEIDVADESDFQNFSYASTPSGLSNSRTSSNTSAGTFGNDQLTGNITTGRGRVNNQSVVALLQQKLRALNFNPGTVDGVFGSQTEAAVIEFQRQYNLTVDGLAGTQTYSKLDELSAAVQVGSVSSPPSSSSSSITNFPDNLMLGLKGHPTLGVGRDNDPKLVATIQRRLKAKGISPGTVDGVFGSQTEAAVKKFQKLVGTDVDGNVGQLTYSQLDPAPQQPTVNSIKPSIVIGLKNEKLIVYGKSGEQVFQSSIGWSGENAINGYHKTKEDGSSRWHRTQTGLKRIDGILEGEALKDIASSQWDSQNVFGDMLYNLTNFDGSQSVDELHGSDYPRGRSHGCIRVRNSDIATINTKLKERWGKDPVDHHVYIVDDLSSLAT